MRDVPISEARTHFSALMRAVAAGEIVRVTRNGKPLVLLEPLTEAERLVHAFHNEQALGGSKDA